MKIAKTGVDCILGKVILVKVFPHPLWKNFSLGIIYPFTNPFGQRVWAAVALDSVGHCWRQCEPMLTVLRYTVWLLLVTVWATVETVRAAQFILSFTNTTGKLILVESFSLNLNKLY